MRFSGDYFELTDRLPTAAKPRASSGSVLVISVAKRIVKSAVRRNTVRRVVRESWRESWRVLLADPAMADAPPRQWLMRLRAHPVAKTPKATKPRKDRKDHGEAKPLAAGSLGGSVGVARANAVTPGFAAVKRLLRADADRLFSQALRAGNRRPRTVHFSPVDQGVPGSRRDES